MNVLLQLYAKPRNGSDDSVNWESLISIWIQRTEIWSSFRSSYSFVPFTCEHENVFKWNAVSFSFQCIAYSYICECVFRVSRVHWVIKHSLRFGYCPCVQVLSMETTFNCCTQHLTWCCRSVFFFRNTLLLNIFLTPYAFWPCHSYIFMFAYQYTTCARARTHTTHFLYIIVACSECLYIV